MNKPTLYIFSGLPGAGKSTLAKALAQATGATYLRIDTVEQSLRDLCNFNVEGEGYRLSYRIASDNLENGISVIADSCNPIDITRREWVDVAKKVNAGFINIEVICSDKQEHKQRVENRKAEVDGLPLPTWAQVIQREYRPWQSHRLTIDTAKKSVSNCVKELLDSISFEEQLIADSDTQKQH